MRGVAVTEGDKVGAQMTLGTSVDGFGVADLVEQIQAVGDGAVSELLDAYGESYRVSESLEAGGEHHDALRQAARIEAGMRAFLEAGGYVGFTDTFEDLPDLPQLPGIAVQRLMAEGYGFGAEGDWKTAAFLRAAKVMAEGLAGGTSFMEDYTYHFEPGRERVLGAHMLEVCPSISSQQKPSLEIHALSIGDRSDPPRLVFTGGEGPALNVSVVEMGGRLRMIVNEVEAVAPDEDMPQLPVARVVWIPKPKLSVAATAWILAGGAHHTVYSSALASSHFEDLAGMLGIEFVPIDSETRIREFRDLLRWNEAYFRLRS
jgi:L-arabinose isomerase